MKQLVTEIWTGDEVTIEMKNYFDCQRFSTVEWEEVVFMKGEKKFVQYWVWIPNLVEVGKKNSPEKKEYTREKIARERRELKRKLVQEKKERMNRYQKHYEMEFKKYSSKKEQNEKAESLIPSEQDIISASKLAEIMVGGRSNKNRIGNMLKDICFSDLSPELGDEIQNLVRGKFVKF
jgi:hypothetical protein